MNRLGCRFSIDFQIQTLGYGFLIGNHKHLAKVSRLVVRLRFLRSIGWNGLTYGFLVVFNVFHQCFVSSYCTNLNYYKRCLWFLVHQRNPQARPYGFKNLLPRKRPSTVTRQLTSLETYRCDFHLGPRVDSDFPAISFCTSSAPS
jgi:hypothetical protein